MNKPLPDPVPATTEDAQVRWETEYAAQIGDDKAVHNRSGIPVKPLYTPLDVDPSRFDADVGFPGQPPYTRGIYATMHRGRTWTQRQLIGLGTPTAYNARLRDILDQGASAVSLIPCNSVFRGYDMDEVDAELLGTCGVVANSADHMTTCLDGVDLATTSCAMNDPSPFTLLAFMLSTAKRRGVDWRTISGTSNQSDYLSHFVANHMFFRLALPGARRILTDHIAWCNANVPRWNPLSVVGQHMQQAGATPAEALAFTLASAIQYADDCVAAGMSPDSFLPRFTFFFDISISFFEEIAKFRAGRRLWARLVRERYDARDPRSWRFKFHAQTSGVDLTRQQPLNNIARVTAQAIAGIFGGLQSLHTDAYDEALSCPTQFGARIAVATQNILREEAHLTDVIDPLGGSYYVESLTNEMEAKVVAILAEVEAAGGMYRAVESGSCSGASASPRSASSGASTAASRRSSASTPTRSTRTRARAPRSRSRIRPKCARTSRVSRRGRRSARPTRSPSALSSLARSTQDRRANVFAEVVAAAEAGCTHGEICGTLRREVGFGHPLIVV